LKSDLIKRIGNPKDEKLRNQFYVFLVCLAISIIIWFLIVLSKKNMETIDFPVLYGKSPSNLVLTNKPDSLLSFRLSSSGFKLITLEYLTFKKPIQFDLRSLKIRKEGSRYTASASTSEMAKTLIREHNLGQELISVSPQTIYFEFSSVTSKKVPVMPNVDFSFEKQFQLLDSLIITPDSVFVMGANEVIDTIKFVPTELCKLDGINKSQTISGKLLNRWKIYDVSLSENEAKISLNVERFTESTIELPIVNDHWEDRKIKTFPEKVRLTYLVALKDYKRINSEMFVLGYDTTVNLNQANKLRVKIIRHPSFIKITRIDPQEVEFLVLKKDD
jgi:hypothetical protein